MKLSRDLGVVGIKRGFHRHRAGGEPGFPDHATAPIGPVPMERRSDNYKPATTQRAPIGPVPMERWF
jgi:hypothetical protein